MNTAIALAALTAVATTTGGVYRHQGTRSTAPCPWFICWIVIGS